MGGGLSKEEQLADAPKLTVYDASIQGVRPHQEDRHIVLTRLSDRNEEMAFFSVYDGHNGTAAADFCADRVHEEVDARVRDGVISKAAIKAAFVATDDAFLMSGEGETRESGCTAVTAVLNRITGRLVVANAGDARCVLSRGGRATPMTVDHKPGVPEERARIEAAGRKVTNNRLDGVLAVSRAIGDLSMKLDLVKDGGVSDPERFALTPVPRVQEDVVQKDDEFILLACDGVWDVLSNQEAVDFIRERLPFSRLRAPPPHVLREEAAARAAAAAAAGGGGGGALANEEMPAGEAEEEEEDPAAAARAVMARLAAGGSALDEESEEQEQEQQPASRGRDRDRARDEGPTAEEMAAIRAARQTMRNRRNVQDMALELANHAVEKGSTDNVSVVVVLLDPRATKPAGGGGGNDDDALKSRVC